MQITHDNKTYKWIGKEWWSIDITKWWLFNDIDAVMEIWYKDTVNFVSRIWEKGSCFSTEVQTHHTPQRLCELWYMVNITDCDHDWDINMQTCRICRATRQEIYMEQPMELITKPEEKPTEEYSRNQETQEYIKNLSDSVPTYWYIETSEMKKSEYWEVFKRDYCKKLGAFNVDFSEEFYWMKGISFDCQNIIETKYLLSPQQWYDTIYDGEKPLWKTETVLHHDKAMEIPLVPEDDTVLDPYNQCILLTRSLNLLIKAHNNK